MYSFGLNEAALAVYQVASWTRKNPCGVISATQAAALFRNEPATEDEIEEKIGFANRWTALHALIIFPALPVLMAIGAVRRTIPGWATTLRMSAGLIRRFGKDQGRRLWTKVRSGTMDELRQAIGTPRTAVLVTVGWNKAMSGVIRMDHPKRGLLPLSKFAITSWPFTAHTMIAAAYDPDHTSTGPDGEAVSTPWGFINSWTKPVDKLFWMTEDDFAAIWGFRAVVVPRHRMLIVTEEK
ncbi:MAG: hypothetical protein JXJ17_17380 [Anaerolineae bacterium]|nr:hypothetical protein [Anaerolineae bacterium]